MCGQSGLDFEYDLPVPDLSDIQKTVSSFTKLQFPVKIIIDIIELNESF